jgi:HD-like signal output (HDOD) protein
LKADLHRIYKNVLEPVTPGPTALSLLQRVVANDDEGDAYENALRLDRFFTAQTVTLASAALKKSVVKSLSHATALFGKETIRNFVFGHSLQRIQNQYADKNVENINQAKDSLKCALAAEELAVKNKSEYAGLVFGSAYIFDLLQQKISSTPELAHLQPFFDKTWRHCLRTGILAHAFTHHESVTVKLNRLAFAGGILHDVGKIVLAIYQPQIYEEILKKFEEAQPSSVMDDRFQAEIESNNFQIAHPEIGALLCSHFEFISELESVVDFHHDFSVLKTRDPDGFLLAHFVNVADRIAFYLETKAQIEVTHIQKLLVQHKPYFPLDPVVVHALVLTLRSKGLLP